jgi:hypothetical protein
MFDLEKAIVDWRRDMRAAGIKTPVPLEELEIHLREEIERQLKSGSDEQNAFRMSVQQMGQPDLLKQEFKKSERTFMKKPLIILAGIFGVLVGTGLILPALAKYKEQGAMVHDAAMGLLIGISIVLGGIGTAFYGFRKRKA